jgi:outer membrane murein-binding lipoprotein Lpp
MERQFFAKDYAPKVWTEEEMAEKRRQQALLGVRLTGRKFYCGKKLTDTCQHFFHGRGQFGRCGVEEDGKHFVQIVSINEEVKTQLAALSSDSAFHKFSSKCYDKVCEIHAKRLETAKAAREADQDNSKNCQTEKEKMQKDQACRSADRILQQQQKAKKPQPVFDKGDLKTWCSLPAEDADRSKNDLTANKTGGLKKADDLEKQIQKFTTEVEVFQKKVDALKPKLEAASDEETYKNIRLTFDYNVLQVEKLQKKIGKNEEKKANIQTQLDIIEKQISILNCVLDHQNLLHEVKNFHDRKTRVIERMRKILQDRDALNATRENLNKLWHELTKPKESDKKRISVFSQSPPEKEEELCEALALKASADVYFI